MPETIAVILAAGKGTRMKSALPKILHPLWGRPVIDYVLDLAETLRADARYLVVGHEQERVKNHIQDRATVVIQEPQLGTGHALQQVAPFLRGRTGTVLVLSGDMPLLRPATLQALLDRHRESDAPVSLLTTEMPGPTDLGRIVRNDEDWVQAIVEAKDATPDELRIREVNLGTYCFDLDFLLDALPRLGRENAQGELYLTDTIALAVKDERCVDAVPCADYREALGINTQVDLAEAGEVLRRRILEEHMQNGVTIVDPATTYIEPGVTIASNVTLLPATHLEGRTRIAEGCAIGPGAKIHSSVLEAGVTVQYSVITASKVGAGTAVGPYAHVRPGTTLGRSVKIGNFVEVKKSSVGDATKVSHLSYLGDAQVGARVNIGAGVITCNFDGTAKHVTVIGDDASIGANTNLVAPVTVGAGAKTGAGSVVIKNVPEGALAAGVPARVIKHPAPVTRP